MEKLDSVYTLHPTPCTPHTTPTPKLSTLNQDMETLERDLKIALDASSLAEAKLRNLEV